MKTSKNLVVSSLVHGRLLVTISAVLAFAACSPPPPGPDVVATFRNGSITTADIEARVLALPQNQKRPEDGDFRSWFGEIAKTAAIEQILLADVEAGGFGTDPDFETVWRQQRKQVLGAGYVQTRLPAPPAPEEEALRQYYDEHEEEFGSQDFRQARHIFRQHREGADAMQEIEDLRRRAIAGESFVKLAREHSHSESRHRDGDLGFVRPGQLSPAVDRVIFSLEPRTPSAPVNTAEGVHLFWVETTSEGRRPSYEEVRGQIAQILTAQRRQEAIDELGLDADLPEDSYVPSLEELQDLLGGNNGAVVVLRVGDSEVTAAQLMQQLASTTQGRTPTLAGAEEMLQAYKNSELLSLRAEREGIASEPAVAQQLEQLEKSALVNFASQRRFQAYLDDHTEDLQSFYEANQSRYGEPLRLRLEHLQTPITADADKEMVMLEEQRDRLNRGELTLAEVAEQVGGRVEILDWQSMPQIAATNPQLANMAPLLAAGQHSPPYRTIDAIEMVRVVEREEPRMRPLAEVEDAVRRDYVAGHGQETWRTLIDEMLEENRFMLNPAGLDALDPAHQAPES